MDLSKGHDNTTAKKDYRLRRLLVLLILLGIVALFWSDASREYLKTVILMGMPGVVIWSYRRRFIRFSWTWWASTLLILGLIAGFVFMFKGVPDRIAVKSIERQGAIYLSERKYDLAEAKYRELEGYDREARMERKIDEVLRQKEFDADYRRAQELIGENKRQEARQILENIPFEAVVYPEAQKLLKELEKD